MELKFSARVKNPEEVTKATQISDLDMCNSLGNDRHVKNSKCRGRVASGGQ